MKNIYDYRELTSIIIEVKHRMRDMHRNCAQYHQETMIMIADASYISEELGLYQLTDVLYDLSSSISAVTGIFSIYEAVDAYEGYEPTEDDYEYMRYLLDPDESVYNASDFYDLSDWLS